MTTDEIEPESRLDWRDRASYAYTQHLTRDAWPWELLRRNPDYRAAWRAEVAQPATTKSDASATYIVRSGVPSDAAARWGLVCFRGSRLFRSFRRSILAAGRLCLCLSYAGRLRSERRSRYLARHRLAPRPNGDAHDAGSHAAHSLHACRPEAAAFRPRPRRRACPSSDRGRYRPGCSRSPCTAAQPACRSRQRWRSAAAPLSA
jgi:hypothetical protein